MLIDRFAVAASNGMLFLHDEHALAGPDIDGRSVVYATRDCIAITVIDGAEGGVDVLVASGELPESELVGLRAVWSGRLASTGGVAQITDVSADVLWSGAVTNDAFARVFADDDVESARVAIEIGSDWWRVDVDWCGREGEAQTCRR